MPYLALAGVLALGLVVGSFVNVVIHRVPRGESLLAPGSRCPRCGQPVRARHNVPVLGWLWLRGRCADCAAPIGWRYPAVELTTGVLFVAVTLHLDRLGLLSALPAYLYLVGAGVALAAIDVEHHRLPDAITLPSVPVVAILLAFSAWWRHDPGSLLRAAAGAVVLSGFYLLVHLVHPAAMGLGDVKLAVTLGGLLGYLSWAALAVGGFAAFVFGAATGIALMLAGRASRRSALAFGPFMVAGALFGVFFADAVAAAYRDALLWTVP